MARIILSTFLLLLAAALGAVGLGALDPLIAPPRAKSAPLDDQPTIAIAPTTLALTFARDLSGATFAVTAYERGRLSGVALNRLMAPGEDAISLVNRLGYDALLAEIGRESTHVSIDARLLDVPVDLGDRHIAAGANYRAHAEEASVRGGPFLFPKYAAPTPARAPVPVGEALLDYEVELCLVTMRALAPDDGAQGGLILCNDFTDRARLLRELDPGRPESGAGFPDGKSAPGYLPVGDLFVVPRDLRSFARNVMLALSVNGVERQSAPASLMVWDLDAILREAGNARERTWAYGEGAASLPFDGAGRIPERTLILTGTPGGTIFRGVYPSAYVRGVFGWIVSGAQGRLSHHVIESHIATARAARVYLQAGDTVEIRVEKLGALANTVE